MGKSVNPEMIILARESRGLSQKQLAASLSVSQGKISKIENGLLGVSEAMLSALSKALDYPKEFFLIQEQVYGPGISGMGLIYHRKRKTLPVKTLELIQSQMNIRRIHLARLLQAIELKNDNQFPHLDIDDYSGDIEAIATAVRSGWSLPRGPIRNLTQAIESAGGVIIKCDFGTAKIDALSQWLPGLPPLFFINVCVPGDRLRFSLAHELGHIIMHSFPTPDMEFEADKFAGAFLMPSSEIGPELNSITLRKLATLKPRWKVSMGALLYRARDLNKITESQSRNFWIQMSKAGYRKREPVELDIPSEEPSLLTEIIDTYRNELKYDIPELSRVLALNEAETRSMYLRQKSHLSVIK